MKVSAIILAGGKSRRMGSDKAALDFGGISMLEYQISKLKSLGFSDIMVSGYQSSCRTIFDIIPNKGPLGGIQACLAASLNDSCFVISVDSPLIPKSTICSLIQNHCSSATILSHKGKIEPLIGVYDKSLSVLAYEILQTSETSVMTLLDKVGYYQLFYRSNEEYLVNCNTPEDYYRALSLSHVGSFMC